MLRHQERLCTLGAVFLASASAAAPQPITLSYFRDTGAEHSLARREPQRALKAVDDHARKFPAVQPTEERDSLWIQILVNAGRFGEARTRATQFQRHYPERMLLPAVEAALASIKE